MIEKKMGADSACFQALETPRAGFFSVRLYLLLARLFQRPENGAETRLLATDLVHRILGRPALTVRPTGRLKTIRAILRELIF